jgi:hypothetical protein
LIHYSFFPYFPPNGSDVPCGLLQIGIFPEIFTNNIYIKTKGTIDVEQLIVPFIKFSKKIISVICGASNEKLLNCTFQENFS